MQQGVLPFHYEGEVVGWGMTGLSGLGVYLDLLYAAGLPQAADREVRIREKQGYGDGQMVVGLVLLNLAGGEAVGDIDVLEGDAGLCRLVRRAERHGEGWREQRAQERRWRRPRERTMPAPSAVFRYLAGFVGEDEQEREQGQAFIPAATAGLRGLGRVNRQLVAWVQRASPQRTATLDMDATLVETEKAEALFSYKGTKAYQPLQTYWAEQDVLVQSEFRDGNVPAGHEQLRVLKEGLAVLPAGVERVYLRSDTAGYQQDLLLYCGEGKDERFGMIEFAVGADMTVALQEAVRETPPEAWRPLDKETAWGRRATGQEWAEVNFVPDWVGHTRRRGEYRYVAVREPLWQGVLPGMEGQLPFPALALEGGRVYKVTAVVTNRDLPGDQLLGWYRERCGKSEEVHSVLKSDLAGGRLPSGSFGENAAWWAMTVLAYNVHTAVKRLLLSGSWAGKRLKALRYGLIGVPGRVLEHGRRLVLRVSAGHPGLGMLLEARRRLLALAAAPG